MCRNINLKLSILSVIFAFIAMVLVMPTVEARGGGHHAGSGSHGGGHGRHFGGHRGNHGGHSRHFGGHRSHNRGFGSHRHSSRSNYNYYPRSYGYSYAPRYSSRSYLSYRPRHYSPRFYSNYTPPVRYISINTYPSSYPGSNNTYNAYNSNSADIRYIEKDMEAKVMDNEGWRLLAQNRASEALTFFAGQAGRYQKDGIPKVGFALSTAIQGDLDRAAWAMRRAFRIDPNTLHYVNIEQPLRVSVNKLIGEYNAQLEYAGEAGNSDAAFMISALNYLLHNEDAARLAIEEAVGKARDNSQSAQNLYNLVINTN